MSGFYGSAAEQQTEESLGMAFCRRNVSGDSGVWASFRFENNNGVECWDGFIIISGADFERRANCSQQRSYLGDLSEKCLAVFPPVDGGFLHWRGRMCLQNVFTLESCAAG